ncbi:ABC transporter substrate-binding protein [Aromatoleum toluclasticum]|uniref:ABC transporter substrate-binding protein n=1 Tax=Aromatoleum toluclasticum TaxID=92003 RepID=UPI001D189EB6|nr:ABC transporter substrate-binding protein [Aromatoleum toluclasticum]MCC4114559.1 ABC transporter substrate-binding protein [Aromatoleum toluclasticum]
MSPFLPRLLRTAALACACVLPAAGAHAERDGTLYAAAVREGRVIVHAATDERIALPLIRAFEQRYPGVRVEYEDLNSGELSRRFLDETARGAAADVLWSSAVDLQIKLVNDGYAQPYRSTETAALPEWAVWKNEAFGTTFEPVAIAYNRKLLTPAEMPATHAGLLRVLAQQPERFRGKLATYEPSTSGLGFMLHTQDVIANPVVFWKLAEAFGRTGTATLASTTEMLDRIASGEALIGYNVLGSYALLRAHQDPAIGVVLPRDYTLVLSRVAFIARGARHPNAARLWLDYVLSREGQQLLAQNPGFFSVRDDVPDDAAATELRRQLGGAFRPIPIGPGLMTYLDQVKRRDFLRKWHHTLFPAP